MSKLPSLRELLGQLFHLPQLKRKPAQLPQRLRRLLEAGLTFRWLDRIPEKAPGRRLQRRRARQRPRRERLEAERAERLRRLQFALDLDRVRRERRARARARRRAGA